MVTAIALGVLAPKLIVFIAGHKSHGPGEHEYELGCEYLAKSLADSRQAPRYNIVVAKEGWPTDPKVLDRAATILVFADGGNGNENNDPKLGDHWPVLERQMKRGCGLVLLHYATYAPKRLEDAFFEWTGGYFDYESGDANSKYLTDDWTMKVAGKSPLAEGVSDVAFREELYYNMRLKDDDSRRIPVFMATSPHVPEPQLVAWGIQRKGGGRSFMYTGGHFLDLLKNSSVRKMLLNAIVWTARDKVPKNGIE